MKRVKHKVFKRQKHLLSHWMSSLKFRPLKHKQEMAAIDEQAKKFGLPTSAETKAKQALVFLLTRIGAFERLKEAGEE